MRIRRVSLLCNLAAITSALLPTLQSSVAAEAARPNLVVFLTDDQPQGAMGCMGNRAISTPNLDRLAAEGILFENSFVASAICCVSRASFLTGQHMRRHGINSFEKPLTAEQWMQTYPALLRRAGYRTAFLGKFAIGNPKLADEKRCLPAGAFDLWYGFPQAIAFRQQAEGKERYLTTVIEEKAAGFLREQPKDRPFLLILALKEPHGPQDFEDPDLPPDLVKTPIPAPPTMTTAAFARLPPAVRESRNAVGGLRDEAKYQEGLARTYRYISRADLCLGRIRAALEARGLADNTVIVYTSDNGSMEGAHGLAGKWNMYEESIRVPLLVRDPRLPAAARGRRAQMALNIDLAPTLLALAGLPAPTGMQGMDLGPILRDPAAKGRAEWYYEHDTVLREAAGRPLPRCEGVRTERWKYTVYKDTNPPQEELFDLNADPREEDNLVADPAQAARLSDLRRRCAAYRDTLR